MTPKLTTSTRSRQLWPWLALSIIVLTAGFLLRNQGRLWLCDCGQIYLWSGDVWSANNSQHISDPYSFTHMLHGLVICGVLAWLMPKVAWSWRLTLAVSLEALWEVVENTEFVINRYRGETAALGYQGDTVVNSLGDILFFVLGFLLARKLGFRLSLAFFVLTEALLIVFIRDSLIINIIMLLYPVEAIKTWQMGH
jgi:hypothetical protein